MRKLLIVCLSLTLCCMSLLGLISAHAAANENATIAVPNAAALEQPPQEQNNAALVLPAEDFLPVDSGESEALGRAPMMALTFDDGPSAAYTPALLDGLAERGVRVTFFMVGARAEKAPDIVLRIYEEGHAFGGHSYDHSNRLTKLSNAELDRQVNTTAEIIARITEAAPSLLLRPPYGAINEETALKTGKAIMMWNIDPRDWDVRDAEKVREHIVEHAMDGGVVICHDIVASTAAGVLAAIDDLQAEGWVFVTLPELYAAFGIPLEAGGIYRGPEAYTLPQN